MTSDRVGDGVASAHRGGRGARGRAVTRSAALAVAAALAGCRPLLYELIDGAESGHGSETMSSMTDSDGPVDPTATGEPPPPPPLEPCGDGDLDAGETDVDCGGTLCPPCGPGAACKVGKDCASGHCQGGLCAPEPGCAETGDCPPEPCRAASCSPDTNTCVYVDLDGEPCDDGDLCTEGGVCKSGQCVSTPRDCSHLGGPCQFGFCNPQTGNCAFEPAGDGEPCQGVEMCMVEATCWQGTCSGKPLMPLLFADFMQPAGWLADPPWEIGPAVPSVCAEEGFEDPADDHSPGPDPMLAGAGIGTCLMAEPLPLEACLTSPPIEGPAEGPIWLSYHSQLSAPTVPGGAHVDVWAGGGWQTIFDTEGKPFFEPTWEMHGFDLSPFMNPELRVRFCHSVPAPGLPFVAGWSVDDVYVGAPGCEPW